MFSRFLFLGLLALTTLAPGCVNADSELSGADVGNDGAAEPEDDGRGSGGANGCQVASDCVLAASTCCECPAFAVPSGGGYDAGCEDVDCGARGLCPAVEAVCDEGQCLMICSPVITDKLCSFGFQVDEGGCLVNECASGPTGLSPECEIDTDCVQVPADCCGCAAGGLDKAVPQDQADAEEDGLNCPVDPACPDIDVCNQDESAQCIAGSCALTASNGGPMQDPPPEEVVLCGTPDLPTCGDGSTCVLNGISANEATTLGVGSCVLD